MWMKTVTYKSGQVKYKFFELIKKWMKILKIYYAFPWKILFALPKRELNKNLPQTNIKITRSACCGYKRDC